MLGGFLLFKWEGPALIGTVCESPRLSLFMHKAARKDHFGNDDGCSPLSPTSLCGVLVSGSVSRLRPPPPPPRCHTYLLRAVVCVQAWHLVTSLLLLRGRRGAYGTGLALVASLAAGGPALTQRGKKHLHRVVHATVRVLAALCFRTRLCCTSCFAACSCTKQSGILSPVTSLAGGAGCRRVVCLGPTLGS